VAPVNLEILTEQLFQSLISGDRQTARQIADEALDHGLSSEQLSHEVYWPVMELISTLYRKDQLSTLAHHYATRLLRSLTDQAQSQYEQKPRRNRKILLFSGEAEADELAGLLVADIAEADGYDVFFGGGGVANDEVLAEIGEQRPDILLLFASGAPDAPNIRQLIDTIRSVGACPDLQLVVGGGVFNRAEGLAEEIGADVWARSPAELLEKLIEQEGRRATEGQRTVGRTRRPTRKTAAA
jgi:methanogenic corrinoid protein MtbC1